MMDFFDQAWDATGRAEGGYSNHPDDPGGETMWGVTVRIARAHGYTGPMKDLPRDLARRIARQAYWEPLRLDEIARIAPRVAQELFDTNFNLWHGAAVLWLQRALNALNREQTDFPEIIADGNMGTVTVSTLAAYMRRRGPEDGESVMVRCLNAQQLCDYMRQAEKTPAKEQFLFGWVRQRVRMDA